MSVSARVLLVDRHRIIRQGIRILLEREELLVVGEAADPAEAARLAPGLRPDVVVLEGQVPTVDTLESARRITQACPTVRAVVLTRATPREDARAAMRAGVRGYVLTSQKASDLAHAIREVARGATCFGSTLSDFGLGAAPAGEEPLTPRERQVLQLIAEGRTTKEIAQVLQRSAKTADAHRTRLMEKLDIHQVAGLVRYAIRRGIIEA